MTSNTLGNTAQRMERLRSYLRRLCSGSWQNRQHNGSKRQRGTAAVSGAEGANDVLGGNECGNRQKGDIAIESVLRETLPGMTAQEAAHLPRYSWGGFCEPCCGFSG